MESDHTHNETAEPAQNFGESEPPSPSSTIPNAADEPIAESIEIIEPVQDTVPEESTHSEEPHDEPQDSSENVTETKPADPDSAPAN